VQNKLKIIGGDWRSRLITFDDAPDLRPTPTRVRETLFNWLQQDIAGSRCLDLFSGSGALGLEAASRGAKAVTLVENNARVCDTLRANIARLNALQVQVINQDVMHFLDAATPENAGGYDLVFLDPPFARQWVAEVCHKLEDKGWLNQYAKIYVESPAQPALTGFPRNWRVMRHKTAGEVGYHLLTRDQTI
jgi:16S rRNA (guanine966-N2)-methyltransferase